MKKTRLLLMAVAVLAGLNVCLYSCVSAKSTSSAKGVVMKYDYGSNEDLAARTAIPANELTCYSGGKGAENCSISPGIKVGDFISIGCGVTCPDGFYACCGERCACVPDNG